MIQLWTFLLAILGLVIHTLIETFRRDLQDEATAVTPFHIMWAGPMKWKTMANVLFVGSVAFFCDPAVLQGLVGATYAGVPLGKFGAVVFGFISEIVLFRLVRQAQRRAKKIGENGNGKEEEQESDG
ncbi:MAG: hypothetical protein ABIJ95_03190 [Pseudomonadota bacterium]